MGQGRATVLGRDAGADDVGRVAGIEGRLVDGARAFVGSVKNLNGIDFSDSGDSSIVGVGLSSRLPYRRQHVDVVADPAKEAGGRASTLNTFDNKHRRV